ncbi:right-handed parallel beta-helix repeat-containing protein [Massilia sp. 9I]|uniref:right-handed parallel beta-helix repeat-containing protein n=1 Tax=Massilia sp. 9I TaxID=2653152 RepID=UPI0012F2E30E|nr:right-handed parallel beta-helix repeat-containing protein [Massilia sp. 9I]VXC21413.1 conserved hypothetical protein [Massilia sp. 9I]
MSRRILWLAAVPAAFGLAVAGAALFWLQGEGVTPRALAPYLQQRAAGHNPLITGTGDWMAESLRSIDRGAEDLYVPANLVIGAQPLPAGSAAGAPRLVTSTESARQAFAAASPGDTITFAPGSYRIRGSLDARRPGLAGSPIVVRAQQPGTVVLELDAVEGIVVAAPYWRFENLDIRGACQPAASCEHAFHVVGKARGFAAVNNTITDFNAHFKINGNQDGFPDAGLIEQNTLTNSAPRRTSNPVTPVDLVAASDWVIRANLITDFIKADGDRISYGAFAKGAAARTRFERNVVVCEQRLRGFPGERVGLSFGGGGTGKPYCRDSRCITEHDAGVMESNLIASCSDAGVYVNSSAGTRLLHNTVLDTAGVQVRFPESSAELDGNLIDGAAVTRNGGQLRLGDNRESAIAALYLGWHPQRSLFADASRLDLRWDGAAPRRVAGGEGVDLCGAKRPAQAAYGAFEDFSACLAKAR